MAGPAIINCAILAAEEVGRATGRVIDLVLKEPAIVRSSTVIALATQVPYRVLPLARATS